MPLLRVKEASKYLGVDPRTVRRLFDKGVLRGRVISSRGDRYIDKSSLDEFMGRYKKERSKGAVIYARVSTKKQADGGNLDRQKDRLIRYCEKNGIKIVSVISDIASGVNENRRGLNKVLRLLERGEADTVVVEHRDRLSRFGYGYLERLIKANNGRVVVVEDKDTDYHEELVDDLISIVSSFSARIYGKRGARSKKLLQAVKNNV